MIAHDRRIAGITEAWDRSRSLTIAQSRRVDRIFCKGGGGGAYLKNWDQIMNVLNDTLC